MYLYFEGNPRNYTALGNWISFVLIHTRKKINKVSVLDLGAPRPRWDDLRFSNTTSILQKKKQLCGLLVLK